MIHGGIDGYSRLVVFLRASTNNRSETMTVAFMRGPSTYGVPSRVRSDHGLENVGVAAFMIGYRGPRRGSIITGRSVHNQRIERLWRDLFQSCTGVFHRFFCIWRRQGNCTFLMRPSCGHFTMCTSRGFRGQWTSSVMLGTTTDSGLNQGDPHVNCFKGDHRASWSKQQGH